MKFLRWERVVRKINFVTGFILLILFVNCFYYMNRSANDLNAFRPVLRVPSSPFNFSLLDNNDFNTLLNLKHFRFVLNNARCLQGANVGKSNNDSVFVVIFIHSAPKNFKKRLAIRYTWGNESNFVDVKVRVVFTLGSVVDTSVQKEIERENEQFHDLVQGSFIDSYRNLSYKHVMGLKWVTYYCQNAKFVFKTDDDIFVDIFQLIFYLKGWHSETLRNFMSCYVVSNPYPKRSVRSKWHVTYDEFPGKYYPEYCSGWGILMSPDVVFNLYTHSRDINYFWVDDVFIYGLLAQRIGVRRIDLTSKLAIEDEDITEWLNKDELSIPPLFGHPDTDTETIYALWNKSIKYYRTKYNRL